MAARYRWNGYLLDVDAFRLERDGAPVALEPKALELLAMIVERPHHLFTKQEIFDTVWRDTAVTDHALTRVVAQLRKALGDDPRAPICIETVPSRGYRWIAAVDVDATEAAHPSRQLLAPAAAGIHPAAASAAPGPSRLSGLGGALVLIVVAALGIVAGTRLDTREGTGGRAADPDSAAPRWPVQVTTHAGLDVHPDLSPLGDAVAYSSDRSGAFEVYVRPFGATGRDAPVTSGGGQNIQPAWSPDGRQLAYHSSRDGGIWVIPSRGGLPRQLVPAGSSPAWSPDGTRLAFQSDEQLAVTPTAFSAQHGSTIVTVRADGGDRREVTRIGRPMGGHAAPSWSPDGRFIAFTVFEGGEDDGVWMAGLETGDAWPLLRRSGVYELAFAPGGAVLYATNGEAAIMRLPIDPVTGRPRGSPGVIPIAGVPGVRGVSIAADGRRLAFAGIALNSQIWAQPVTLEGKAAGQPRAITNDTSHRNSVPSVSPDGAKVAYMSRRTGESAHVAVIDVDGRNGMQVTADESKDWLANWFPDSRRVAYLARRGDTRGLWSVDVATRREELFIGFAPGQLPSAGTASQKGQLAEFELAPSMTRVAFTVLAPPAGRRVLYVSVLDRFAPRPVGDGGQSVGYPAWSPDERQLAVEIKEGSSMQAGVIDVERGTLRVLTSERGQTWTRSWSPDGRRIAVSALRNGLWDLRWIDVSTGRQGPITPPSPANVYVRYPEWSPRGDLVVFERGEVRGNVWTLTLE